MKEELLTDFEMEMDIEMDEMILDEIECSDIEISETPEEEVAFLDIDIDNNTISNHKISGKHALKYDTIFKGKKDELLDEVDDSFDYANVIEVDKSSIYYSESMDNEDYIKYAKIRDSVHHVLSTKTSINFKNDRRKPSRVDFNEYFRLLKTELKEDNFSNVELLNELAVYFSDNLFSMFKLLDNRWKNMVIAELQDHIGKTTNCSEITNRNIYVGTELEFKTDDFRIITGVVLETDYRNSSFTVDSYKNIYEVEIKDITKIINNTKYKNNLSKLSNIDFL